MIDERTLVTIIKNTTQEECRELGEHFLSLADKPRDAAWKAMWRARLEQLPKASLALEIEEARKRTAADLDQSSRD